MNLECGIQNEHFIIKDVHELDPVTVILKDNGNGSGKVIIECYGQSWTTYFGMTGKQKLRQFLSHCDSSYLLNRFLSHDFHRPPKREKDYVLRITQAVIDACKMLEDS